jgi:hypothetical protein
MCPSGQLFLIHCERDARRTYLDAAIVIVEPGCPAGWIPVVTPDIYGGDLFAVQLPVELLGRDSRYKGFSVRLPLRENCA